MERGIYAFQHKMEEQLPIIMARLEAIEERQLLIVERYNELMNRAYYDEDGWRGVQAKVEIFTAWMEETQAMGENTELEPE